MTPPKQIAKYRGDLVSRDGGVTWRSTGRQLRPTAEGGHGGWGDSPHMGASQISRELGGWNPWPGSPDADLLPDLPVLTPRSRDLDRNHGYAHGSIRTKLDNVVGPTGLRLSAMPDWRALGKSREWAEEWSTQVEAEFAPWAETTECDASGLQNLAGLCRTVFQGALLNGSGLALPLWMPRPRSRFATRIQVIESDRLQNPLGSIDGPHLRGGVAIDDYGRPDGFWIRKAHPGDAYLGVVAKWAEWEFVPAETEWGRKRVLHCYDIERAGQTRGKPDFSTVLTRFKMLDHYERIEVQAAVAQAMCTTFIETPMGDEATLAMLGGGAGSVAENVQAWVDARAGGPTVQLKGASAISLYPGEKIAPFMPTRPTAVYGVFVEHVLRHIAAGLDLPLELLTKDFTKTTYTSARAMLMEAWRFFLGRRKWLADSLLAPLYVLWLEERISAGTIQAPGFYDNIYAYTRCKWIGTGRGWIDATKEVDAAGKRMALNLSTLEIECAEQGLDWEEVVEQRAVEAAMLRKMGLPLPEEVMAGRAALVIEQAEQAGDNGAPAVPAGGAV
jgi:lambda family phage portal protein